MKSRLRALILAGGASSRLFPFNKLLCDLTGTGRTLIQQAFDRAASFVPKERIAVLAVHELVNPIRRQLSLSKSHFFVDPARRGTWPALLWAMAFLRKSDPDAVLAVLTGDHVIPRLPAFKRAAERACRLAAEQPALVMLGVDPGDDAAEWTGYGVFRVDGPKVIAFAEKPTQAQAQKMIRQGGWQWNSGMFFFRISTAEETLRRYQPQMAAQYEKLIRAVVGNQMKQARALYAEFPAKIPHPQDAARMVDNTIDFAIMTPLVSGHHTPNAYSLTPVALAVTGGLPAWTDLGQWEALHDVNRTDKRKNIRLGKVQSDPETTGCILAADRGYHLTVKGMKNAVVALADRGLLILSRAELPRLKEHVAKAGVQKPFHVSSFNDVHVTRAGKRVVVSRAAFIR